MIFFLKKIHYTALVLSRIRRATRRTITSSCHLRQSISQACINYLFFFLLIFEKKIKHHTSIIVKKKTIF